MVNPTRKDIEDGMTTIETMMTDLISLVTRFDGVAFERLFDAAFLTKELYGKDVDPPLTHSMDLDNISEVSGWSALAIAHDLALLQYNGGPLGLDVFKWFQNELRPTLLVRARDPKDSQVIKCAMDKILSMAMGRSMEPEASRCPEAR